MTKRSKGSLPSIELPIERRDLSCGARLLVSPRPGSPITALAVHLRGGPSLDPAGREGTSYLTGNLINQGTRDKDEREIAERAEALGAHLGGSAHGLSGTVVSRDWKKLAELATELLMTPTYPLREVKRQRTRLQDRLLLERDDPRAQTSRRFRKLIYGDHWLGRPAYGTLESVAQIEARHLRSFHKQHWCGRRAVIAVCGDVKTVAVARELERLTAGWNPGTTLEPKKPELPPRAVRIDSFPAEREQVHLMLGHLGVRRADPDYPALVVLDHVLGSGSGFTNRIARKLRDELGLAYSVSANIHSTAGILPGMFQAYIGTSPQHVPTALAGFLDEMRRIQEEPVPEPELELARSYLVGSFVLGFQRAARRASWMITAERHGLGDDELEELPRRFAAVTQEDVQRAARKHLFPDACCVAAAGPVQPAELSEAVHGLVRS